MATTYLGLVLPTEFGSTDIWGSILNTALTAIDAHDHSEGKGARITPAGLNINADLDFGGNDATSLRSVRLSSQTSTLAGTSDVGCISNVGGNLYWNHSAGAVQITSGAGLNTAALSTTAFNTTTVAADTTIQASDTFVVVKVNTTAARSITLPAISGVEAGRCYMIKDASGQSETNAITLQRSGSDTIDGATSMTLSMDYGMWIVVSDGSSNWMVMRPSPDFLTKSSLTLSSTILNTTGLTVGSTTTLTDGTLTIGSSALTTTTLTVGTNSSLTANALTVGANAASAGHVRLPNASVVRGRNAANDGDVIMLALDDTDKVLIGDGGSGVTLSGPVSLVGTLSVSDALTLSNASPTITFSNAQTVTRVVPVRPTHVSTSGGVEAGTALGSGIVFGVMATSKVKITTAYCETQVVDTSERRVFLVDPGPYAWIDGATLTGATLYYRPANGHAAVPAKFPALSITRASNTGGTEEFLLSTNAGWVIDTAANTTAYQAARSLAFTPDQNATIDLANYSYMIRVADEGGSSSVAGLKFYSVVLTFSVTDFSRAAL